MDWHEIEFEWRSGEWAVRRAEEHKWYELFTGKSIRDAKSEIPEPKTGKRAKLNPLQINPLKSMAEAHRDTVIGVLPNHNAMPVKISHPNDGLSQVISQVLKDSNFKSMFMEAVLLMQSRGGHAFKVSWEPQRADLAYRTRLIGIESSDIWPVYEKTDPWRMLECYVGYEIDAEMASDLYGIEVNRNTALYMEYWTQEDYTIFVDGKVVTINVNGQKVPLKGKHNLGRVPIVYVPHVRAGDFWGTSHAEDIEGMIAEINSATTDVGDAVFGITHTNMVGGNLRGANVVQKPLYNQEKQIVGYYWDVGSAPTVTGAQPPFLDYPKTPDIPQGSKDYQDRLWSLMQLQTRTAAAALGEINFSSGRVVGTVMSQLMLPTLTHTQTERTDLATGFQHIDDILLRMLQAHHSDLAGMNISAPLPSEDDLKEEILVTWHPAIPVEVMEKSQMLDAAFNAGTASLEYVLTERGVEDIAAEQKRIWDDAEKAAMIEAKAQAYVEKVKGEQAQKAAETQADAQQALNDQKLKQNEDLHQQKLQQNDDKHKVNLQQMKQGAKNGG